MDRRLPSAAIGALSLCVAGCHFNAGEKIFSVGESAMCAGLLVGGAAAEQRPDGELVVRGQGDFVGEEALFSHAPCGQRSLDLTTPGGAV